MANREKINGFLFALFGFDKPKSRSHILLIVLIHFLCWCLVFFLPVFLYPVRLNNRWFVSRELIDKSIFIGLFYLHYYWLIPGFFEKKKYKAYFTWIMVLYFAYLAQQVVVRNEFFLPGRGPFFISQSISGHSNSNYITVLNRMQEHSDTLVINVAGKQVMPMSSARALKDSNLQLQPPFPLDEPSIFGIRRGILYMSLNNTISSFALLIIVGGFIRLAYSFIRNQNERKALENANLNAEVNFLKSQINPHFLFNTLNSIYSQAHSRSDNTEFSILRLSELLRYVLYDSGEAHVPLEKDIQYINNYIDLQRLRLSPKITLNYFVDKINIAGQTIAPLLLISFIENAFKHGISYTHRSVIDINIGIFEKTLTLSVTNPLIEKDSFGPGGLGLKNVTRRLELLYPGQHELVIQQRDHLHIVNLKLELTNAQLPTHRR